MSGRSDKEKPHVLPYGADIFPTAGSDIETLAFANPGDIPGEEGDGLNEMGIRKCIIGC